MRTILILAVGVWIGREIYTTHAKNQAREREGKIRKALEKFIQEKLPTLPPTDMKKEVEAILGQDLFDIKKMATVLQDIIVPEKSSECSEWISYFKKLEEKFGAENAKTIWLKTWQVNGSTASCTTRPDFNAFFKKHDIDVTNLATAAVASAADLGGSIMGLGKGLTKVLTYGVPIVATVFIGAILYAIIKVAKNTTASDVAALTPAGRAAALLK